MKASAFQYLRTLMKSGLLFLACGAISQANAEAPATENGGWFSPHGNGSFSAAAKNACGGATVTPADAVIPSPNGKRKIVVRTTEDGARAFAVDETGRKFPIPTEGWPCPEIGWSPASDTFFVNHSDGGAVGTYHVVVYRLSKGRLTEIRLAPALRLDVLDRYPKCFRPEEPNMLGIAWASDATRLLVAAQVLSHSNCDNMGTFGLYELAIPSGTMIRRFSQDEAKTLFHDLLGPELHAADDGCFSKPGSCSIPMLHGPKNGQ